MTRLLQPLSSTRSAGRALRLLCILVLQLSIQALGACTPKPLAPGAPAEQLTQTKQTDRLREASRAIESPLRSVSPTIDGWYNASPMLMGLRPEARSDLATRIGVGRLEDLPFYDLKVRLDVDAGTLDVLEDIYWINRDDSPERDLVLRVYGNEAAEATSGKGARSKLVIGDDATCVGRSCAVVQDSPSVISVKFSKPVLPGERAVIKLGLRGVLERMDRERTSFMAQGLSGLMSMGKSQEPVNYGLLSVCDGIASVANFYAVIGRRIDGRWQRRDASSVGDVGSDDLCHVRARVQVPANTRVVSPGLIAHEDQHAAAGDHPATRTYDIAAPVIRNFSIFASGELSQVSQVVDTIVVRSHFLDKDRRAGERALGVAERALRLFEARFGSYPFTELDLVEAPLVGGAGGVEFSGLVAVASMFYRPVAPDGLLGGLMALQGMGGADGPMAKYMDSTLDFTVAHELAHQWWHGLVGSDSQGHPFVDESLAQYSTMLFLEERDGKAQALRASNMHVKMNYHGMRMMGQPDAPVDRSVSAFSTPISYAGLVYGKGPYLYGELRKLLGDQVFFDGLRAYVNQYGFREAPSRALFDIWAQGAQAKAVRKLVRRWLDERYGDLDLGKPDMASMLSGMLPDGASPLDPQMLKDLLGGLSGKGKTNGPVLAPNGGKGHKARSKGGKAGEIGTMLEQMRDLLGPLQGTP